MVAERDQSGHFDIACVTYKGTKRRLLSPDKIVYAPKHEHPKRILQAKSTHKDKQNVLNKFGLIFIFQMVI